MTNLGRPDAAVNTSKAVTSIAGWSVRTRAFRRKELQGPDFTALGTSTYSLCLGCGEPNEVRALTDFDCQQAMHGRAPAQATGLERVLPDLLVFTLQGDGDMTTEGLQEVIHAAARGEKITVICLNNAAFGETGGHMTPTSVIGQRIKSSSCTCAPDSRASISWVG